MEIILETLKKLYTNKTSNELIEEIAEEKRIKITYLPDEKNRSFYSYKEIYIGVYDDPEKKIISFFHELGHNLIKESFMELCNYNTLIIEFECWNIGIKEALKRQIYFSDESIQWGLQQCLSYVGNDERESSSYDEKKLFNIGNQILLSIKESENMNGKKIDWTNLVEADKEDNNHCGGPENCENRTYDSSKADCNKCAEELSEDVNCGGPKNCKNRTYDVSMLDCNKCAVQASRVFQTLNDKF